MPGYVPAQRLRDAVVDWALAASAVTSLIFAGSHLIRLHYGTASGLFGVFIALLFVVVRRTSILTEEENYEATNPKIS